MKKRVIPPFDSDSAKRAVVAVGPKGARGRGFVMEIPFAPDIKECLAMRRIVVTAAHCLPHLPSAASVASRYERTYAGLLGPLGTAKPSIMAECLFVDPVADIAVLGEPDGQVCDEFAEASEAFHEFIDTTASLSMSTRNIVTPVTGWLLSLDGRWTPCNLPMPSKVCLWIKDASDGIRGGMSGSPILLDDGTVIGVVVASFGTQHKIHTEGGPHPRLAHHLPGWLVKQLRATRRPPKQKG